MSAFEITVILFCVFMAISVLCYIDAKYQWRFVDWLNGRCANPFIHSPSEYSAHDTGFATDTDKSAKHHKDKDALIASLQERIEVLEAIVTEPSYELNKKINALK